MYLSVVLSDSTIIRLERSRQFLYHFRETPHVVINNERLALADRDEDVGLWQDQEMVKCKDLARMSGVRDAQPFFTIAPQSSLL